MRLGLVLVVAACSASHSSRPAPAISNAPAAASSAPAQTGEGSASIASEAPPRRPPPRSCPSLGRFKISVVDVARTGRDLCAPVANVLTSRAPGFGGSVVATAEGRADCRVTLVVERGGTLLGSLNAAARENSKTADPAAIDDCIEAVLGQLLTNAATRFPPPPASGSGSGSSAASPSP